MMLRRDLLKLAAMAPALAGPFAVSSEQAAALMREPVTYEPGPERDQWTDPNVMDPQQFAHRLDMNDYHNDVAGSFWDGAAPDAAEYKQAMNRLIDLNPALLDPEMQDDTLGHPLAQMDEAAVNLWGAAWGAGLRAGVAYEHLRQAKSFPVMTCPKCHGGGMLWNGRGYRDSHFEATTCRECGGTGTLQTPTPSLASVIGG